MNEEIKPISREEMQIYDLEIRQYIREQDALMEARFVSLINEFTSCYRTEVKGLFGKLDNLFLEISTLKNLLIQIVLAGTVSFLIAIVGFVALNTYGII